MEVRLYGRFAALAGVRSAMEEAVRRVPVKDGATIGDVLQQLDIAAGDVGHLFLNGQYSGMRRRVRPGDRLGVFPREMALIYRQYFPRIEE